MQVQNPGGGIASVVTDGVTITGNGLNASPVAILQVQADASLQGNGAVGNVLGVTKQTSLAVGSKSNTHWPVIANGVQIVQFSLVQPVTFSSLCSNILTGDAGASKYDFGIYNAVGTLVADVAADASNGFTPLGGAVILDKPCLQGTVTLYPGSYYFAITGNSSTGNWDGGQLNPGSGSPGGWWSLSASNTSVAASTNGKLPSSIVVPGASIQYASFCLLFH